MLSKKTALLRGRVQMAVGLYFRVNTTRKTYTIRDLHGFVAGEQVF